jgi:WD40 repeat protein/tRNA A-37 threonylcarbamoyl transferase component Bud32
MSSLATCNQGHRWETANNNPAGGYGPCPICGAPALASEAKTLAPPTRASELATLPPAPTLAQAEFAVAIAGYEILGELGRGGMGVVYKARQVKADRLVALKMILAGAHASEQDLNRFRTEAHAVARMQHPKIVQVYEVGEQDSRPYFSLEFLEGGSIADRLDGTPWPARKAAELVETLARAMQAAHDKGIVHRDLKPANVLLTADGTPKITDFGLAKRLDSAGQTQTGAIMGTPNYMAPEQAGGKGKEVGPAADVYALGALLYELLTGRPPFRAETPLDTVLQVVSEDPVPPSRLQPKLPRDLETSCLKCLEKQPARRYSSARELADDLCRFLEGEPILARPAGRIERVAKWARRRPAVAALLAVVLVVTLAGAVSFAWAYREALRERDRVQEQERGALRLVANIQIQLADSALREGHLAVAKARLDEVPLEERFWEWHYLKRQAEGGLFTLYGPTSPVGSVAFSSDGTRLSSSTSHGTRIWDAHTGQQLLTLKGAFCFADMAIPGSVALSPDGTRLASRNYRRDNLKEVQRVGDGIWEGIVKIWDARSGEELASFKGHNGTLMCVAYSPDGARLASGSFDQTVKVWDTRTGQQLRTLQGHDDGVLSVAFSPDGARLASASRDTTIKVWDTHTGQELLTFKGNTNWVCSVAFSPDGARLASVGDRVVQVWDARTGQEVLTLKGHTGAVYSVGFSPDGTRLASSSFDQTVKVWDARTGQELLSLKGHTGAVTSVAFSPDGARLASGSQDQTVKLWDSRTIQEPLALEGHTGGVSSLAFSPDGARLASAGGKLHMPGEIKVWDIHTGQKLLTIQEHTLPVLSVAFSGDGARLASAGGDLGKPGEVKVWDAQTGPELLALQGHTDWVTSVAFSPDSVRLASCSLENGVKMWDARSGQELLSLKGFFSRVAFSPDGTRLATGSLDPDPTVKGTVKSTVKVWDARTGQELLALQGHTQPVLHVAFSSDGALLASGSLDRTVRVWDARTGQELLTLEGHTGGVSSLAFSPDGTRLASAGDEPGRTGEVKVWDARTGQQLLVFKGNTGPVAFSPHGARLATGSLDGTVKIWDAHISQEPLSEDELMYRRWVTHPEPEWHAAEAVRCEHVGDWFAAAFHLKRCLTKEPDEALLVRRLRAAALAGLADPKPLAAALAKQPAHPPSAEEVRLARAYNRLGQDTTVLRAQQAVACAVGPRLGVGLLDWTMLLEQELRRQEHERLLRMAATPPP